MLESIDVFKTIGLVNNITLEGVGQQKEWRSRTEPEISKCELGKESSKGH